MLKHYSAFVVLCKDYIDHFYVRSISRSCFLHCCQNWSRVAFRESQSSYPLPTHLPYPWLDSRIRSKIQWGNYVLQLSSISEYLIFVLNCDILNLIIIISAQLLLSKSMMGMSANFNNNSSGSVLPSKPILRTESDIGQNTRPEGTLGRQNSMSGVGTFTPTHTTTAWQYLSALQPPVEYMDREVEEGRDRSTYLNPPSCISLSTSHMSI